MNARPLPAALPHEVAWHQLPPAEVLARLRAAAEGLSATEAAARFEEAGPNELEEEPRGGPLRILLRQFRSLIIWILIGAGVVSGMMGDWVDALAILVIIVINATIAFYQEYHAERSIAALRRMTAPRARVRRGGEVLSIAASAVVSGDVLVLEAGDLVAADARLLRGISLKCVESALTGEAEAVAKEAETMESGDVPLGDRSNMLFMGTSVVAGTGEAVVTGTAMNTELGRIAELINEAGDDGESTPLQDKLNALGRTLGWAALAVVALLFGLGLLRGTGALELFMSSVSLAVAAVPEGLPAVVTVALALGVRRIAVRRALVRRLSAVETLGSTSVICTDKTGTLTSGEMTARRMYTGGHRYEVTGEGYGPAGEIQFGGRAAGPEHEPALRELAAALLGCNSAGVVAEKGVWKVTGDPTEGAMLVAGIKAGGSPERMERDMPRHHEIPFDSDRKRASVIRRLPEGKLRVFTNGAPGSVLENCSRHHTAAGIIPLTAEAREKILEEAALMAAQALRVLGSATAEIPNSDSGDFTAARIEMGLVFVGLIGMRDPPRPEAKAAIVKCHEAGIRVVMITGDHARTAEAIAKELGIAKGGDVLTGAELEKLQESELRLRVRDISVYARVTAGHKLRIVRALKTTDAVVAMTGDGVNDAPAIKGADIGIAMGKTGTEVTKQAADMILTDDNFATIVAAVEEGRGVFNNIRKTLQYLLAGNTAELLLMTVCVLMGLPLPLLPIHLLWINLVTDGLPALCLAADPIDPDVMRERPRKRNGMITDRSFLRTMAVTATLTAATSFAVYAYMLKQGSVEAARTYAFTVLVFAELFRAFGARSESKPVWRISLFSNPSLLIVVVASLALQIWSQHYEMPGRFLKTVPVPWADSLALLALGTLPLLCLEIMKVARRARGVDGTSAETASRRAVISVGEK